MKDIHLPPNRWTRTQSYAQWVRAALALARANRDGVCSLFDSSVPEPRELLRQAILSGVSPRFSGFFTSAFGDGNPFVLDMLAERYSVDSRQVLSTTGATAALSLIYRSFAAPGDHILVESPGFDLFFDLAGSHGLEAEPFRRSGDAFGFDVEAIEAQVRPETRLIILSNLHNPSGMAVPHADMVKLALLAERRGLLVVVDEVYGDYADAIARPCPAATLSPRLVSVSSLTKIFGLGALRCGWIVADAAIIEVLRAVSGRVEFGVSTLSHAISAHVLACDGTFRRYTDEVLSMARPVFVDWFGAMKDEGLMAGAMPDFGCICFPRLPGIADTRAFSEWLCAETGVIVAPGECFGAPGHVRIGFARPVDDLQRGLAGLAAGLRAFARSSSDGAIMRNGR